MAFSILFWVDSLVAKAADCKSATLETPEVRILLHPFFDLVAEPGLLRFPAKEVCVTAPNVRIVPRSLMPHVWVVKKQS